MPYVALRDRDYQPVAVRLAEPLRAILVLDVSGVWTVLGCSPQPLPHTYPITAAVAPRHYVYPLGAQQPPRYRVGWQPVAVEFCIAPDLTYTIRCQREGEPEQSYTVEALPLAGVLEAQGTLQWVYTQRNLVGWVYDVPLVGLYRAGGVRLPVPSEGTELVDAILIGGTPSRLLAQITRRGRDWYLRLHTSDGSELSNDTELKLRVRVRYASRRR